MLTSIFAGGVLAADALGRALLPVLSDYAVRGTMILLLAAAVTMVLRRRSAAVRHAVWTVAMLAVGIVPLLTRTTPSIVVPVRLPLLQRPADLAPLGPHLRTTFADVSPASTRSAIPAPSDASPLRRVGAHPETVAAAQIARAPFSPVWLAWVWMVGAALILGRLLLGTAVMWWRGQQAEVVTAPQWRRSVAESARELGIERPVVLLESRECAVPVTWGILHPTMLLPQDAAGWPVERRRVVALHELAHVARFDAATQRLGQIVVALNWFNPLAWLVVARMRTERECACDDVVLSHGATASDYAGELLAIARTLPRVAGPAPASLAVARCSDIEGRLRAILDVGRERAALSRRMRACGLAAAAPIVVLVAAVRPSARVVPVAAHFSVDVLPAPSAPMIAPLSRPLRPVLSERAIVPAPGTRPTPRVGATATSAPDPAALSPTPAAASLDASTRCPVQADFAHGGVSADRGEVGALEVENDGHRVMVLATDGRCVTVRIDGSVALSADGSAIAAMAPGASVSISDIDGGLARSADVRIAAAGANAEKPERKSEPLYVIDGQIVTTETPKASPDMNPDDIEALTRHKDSADIRVDSSSGYPMVTQAHPEDHSATPSPETPGDYMGNVRIESPPVGATPASPAVPGRVAADYTVDGKSRPWSEGQAWFTATLANVVRETAYDAARRFRQLRASAGLAPVLAEIRQTRSESGRRQEFEALLESGQLSPGERSQATALAQSSLTPSPEKDRILQELRSPSAGARAIHLNVF